MFSKEEKKLFEMLPSIHKVIKILNKEVHFNSIPRSIVVSCVRNTVNKFRSILGLNKNLFVDSASIIEVLIKDVKAKLCGFVLPKSRRVINATGIVLHTNLGRSPLPRDAIDHLSLLSGYYSNLEFNVSLGLRGNRHNAVERLLCNIIGAESAFIVNNNAAAVLICLDTLAKHKETIISRGELVEIGGSFRIPDVMLKSASILREVGTTNRTYIEDYAEAITEKTGLLFKVHCSNYGIIGFTASVSLRELVELGKLRSVLVMEDIGSGNLIDFSKFGFHKGSVLQDSIKSGVDIVTFSGDKLLGGPQAGIIIGKEKYIKCLKKNPLARALRVDKMTLTTLENVLNYYYDENVPPRKIPVLNSLLQPVKKVGHKAGILYLKIKKLFGHLNNYVKIKVFDMSSLAGGGALPLINFPTKCLGIKIDGISARVIDNIMRSNYIPIIGRIEGDYYILDLRTVFDEDIGIIEVAFEKIFEECI